jgi:hypothetical protein
LLALLFASLAPAAHCLLIWAPILCIIMHSPALRPRMRTKKFEVDGGEHGCTGRTLFAGQWACKLRAHDAATIENKPRRGEFRNKITEPKKNPGPPFQTLLFLAGESYNKAGAKYISPIRPRLEFEVRHHELPDRHILREKVRLVEIWLMDRFIGDRAGNYFKRDDPYYESTEEAPGVESSLRS